MDPSQQREGSTNPPAKLSGADSDQGQSSPPAGKVSGQQGNNESQGYSSNSEKSADERPSPSVTTETPTGETTGRSIVDVASGDGGAHSDEDQSLPAVDKVSGQQGKYGSQDYSANSEKSTGDRQRVATVTRSKNMDPSQQREGSTNPPAKLSATPTSEATGRSTDVKSVEGADVHPGKADSLQDGNKKTVQQGNDGSQGYSSNSEKSADEQPSPRVTTETPTGETTGRSIVDVASGDEGAVSDEGQSLPAVDKVSGQQGKYGSQDNSANSEKSTGDRRRVATDSVKAEVVDHPPVIKQADDKRQDLLRNSGVSQKEHQNEETEKQKMSKKEDVEVIGPTATQTELAEETGILGGHRILLVAVFVMALVAMAAQYYLQSNSPPEKTDWQQVDVFLKQMKKVKARFPSQRAELWSRSEIHLKRHLQTSQPGEPVSLILTSGARAERTMHCLARDVASAFSSARKASFVQIEGAGKAGHDSDQVKLDIDRKLQGAFEGDKPVAVIHRLEELPPGSTLIFYRYCDHENAAYKKTFLIFTVLLGDEEEIPAETRLSIVEEMVDDYLQKRFLSPDHPVSFDRMDVNKYGGLWSRISHLILPVAAEDRIEQEGCLEDPTLF